MPGYNNDDMYSSRGGNMNRYRSSSNEAENYGGRNYHNDSRNERWNNYPQMGNNMNNYGATNYSSNIGNNYGGFSSVGPQTGESYGSMVDCSGGNNNSSSYGRSNYTFSSAEQYSSGNKIPSPWGMEAGPSEPTRSSNVLSRLDGGAPTSDLISSISQLTAMGSTESKLALNILSAVLSSKPNADERPSEHDYGAPAHKMRRIEMEDDHHGRSRSPRMRPPVYQRMVQQDRREDSYNQRHSSDNERSYRGRGSNDSYNNSSQNKRLDRTKNFKQVQKEKLSPNSSKSSFKGEKKTGVSSHSDPEDNDKQVTEVITEEEDFKLTKEYMKCIICEIDFDDAKCYNEHRSSEKHKVIARGYFYKCQVTLDLLRAESKLACLRYFGKFHNANIKTFRKVGCRVCKCQIFHNIHEHNRTVEHKMVDDYMNVQCCDRSFNSRELLVMHQMTIKHLKNQMVKALKDEKKIKEDIETEALLNNELEKSGTEVKVPSGTENVSTAPNADATVASSLLFDSPGSFKGLRDVKTAYYQSLKKKDVDELTYSNLPVYDPATPIGLNLIIEKHKLECKACCKQFQSLSTAIYHCQSPTHYETFQSFLKKKETNKNHNSSKKQNKEQAEPIKNKTINSDEGDVSLEDLTNMETVDEAVDCSEEQDDQQPDEPDDLDTLLEEVGEILQDSEDEKTSEEESGDEVNLEEGELDYDEDINTNSKKGGNGGS